MPSVYDLKPRFQRLLRPLVGALARAGVTANQVTVAAVALSAAGGAAIALAPQARWPLLALPAVLFVRMALNAVDGMLAREHGQASRLGAVLNELGDVVADSLLFLPLALVPAVPAGWLVAAVVAALWTEVAGLVAVGIGAARRYDGPMGKSDRAAVFGLLALLLGLGVRPGRWLDVVLAAVVVLALLTVVNRARRALAEAAAAPASPPAAAPPSAEPRRAAR
ncbi:MAG TPA: CDP-alcohol phosphatidyltransferase family protein [Thermoanaerobaculia bacterium]